MATEKMEFQTEVRDMLNLMINSLYSTEPKNTRETTWSDNQLFCSQEAPFRFGLTFPSDQGRT